MKLNLRKMLDVIVGVSALAVGETFAGDQSASNFSKTKLTEAKFRVEQVEQKLKDLIEESQREAQNNASKINESGFVRLNKISSEEVTAELIKAQNEYADIVSDSLSELSLSQLIEIHSSKKISDVTINTKIGRTILEKALGSFILLPEVTQQDVNDLMQAGVKTSITKPMPAFRVAQTKIPVGLYYAVYGGFPDIDTENWLELFAFSKEERRTILAKWKANPELPLTNISVDEAIALAGRLGEITGRRISITTDSQNEYSIRGRTLVGEEPTGSIITSLYYFGNDAAQVSKHGWFYANSGGSTHGVNEHPPGYETVSKHPFGLIQPVGNVWVGSSDGIYRGGSFGVYEEYAASSYSKAIEVTNSDRTFVICFRLAEEI